MSVLIVADLVKHRGSSVLVAGDHQSPVVHALVHVMNDALGNVDKTVFYTDPVDANPVNRTESLHELVEDIRGGKVDLLVILGGNPVYDAPAELEFAICAEIERYRTQVHLGHQNETAELCQWHVNEAHYLEAWSDARAYDGTVSIVQPLIAPLYGGKSVHEISQSALAGRTGHGARSGSGLLAEAAWVLTSNRSGASRCTMDGSQIPRCAPKERSPTGEMG